MRRRSRQTDEQYRLYQIHMYRPSIRTYNSKHIYSHILLQNTKEKITILACTLNQYIIHMDVIIHIIRIFRQNGTTIKMANTYILPLVPGRNYSICSYV